MKDSFHNSIWAIRDARIALLARALSTAGTAVTSIAAILLLHGLGVGPFGIAAFLAALALPTIATMGLAGRIADTVDSRIVLTVTALVQAAACFILGAFPEAGSIYATGFVIACAQAFAQPSWQALLPRVVGDERIGAAVAWQQGLNAVAAPVGAALGGILVSSGHVSWGFWLDGASYLLLALAACAIRERRHGGERAAAGSSWTAGIRIVARDRMVWPLFVAILVFVVLVEGVNPVEVFLARDILGATPWQYGLSEFFMGLGALAGAWIAGRLAGDGRRALATVSGFGVAALSLVAMGLSPGFWIYAVFLTVLAAGFGIGNATSGALITTRTPEAERGRVYAALGGLARTASLFALALGSLGNAALGPRLTFVLAGVAGAATMIVAGARALGAARRPGEEDQSSGAPVRSLDPSGSTS